jgi:glycosyltransferase involved in cell wall biosynthesis
MNIHKTIALLIPCYNEEVTIKKVITDFQKELPDASIYVYDNNSSDATSQIALLAGAMVKKEPLQGKGNVIRSMFRDINADIYIMVDGDDTYPADTIHQLLEPVIKQEADIVVGDRLSNKTYLHENKRNFHNFGNALVKKIINRAFHAELADIMSGYRVLSKRFAKNYPVLCDGFQLETDMTIFALDRKMPIVEIPIRYRDRPQGSESKLNTFADGSRVLLTIFNLYRHFSPLKYFTLIACIFFMFGLLCGLPVIYEYIAYSFVYKVPSAILAATFMLLSIISFVCRLMLDSISKLNKELYERNLKNDY